MERDRTERLGLFPFPFTSVPGASCFYHDTIKTTFRPQFLQTLIMWDRIFFFFFNLMVFRDTEWGLKTEMQWNWGLWCNWASKSLDGLTRTTGASGRPSYQALGCLPSSRCLRFSCLPLQTHLHACTCSPPFQEFYYCLRQKRGKKRI